MNLKSQAGFVIVIILSVIFIACANGLKSDDAPKNIDDSQQAGSKNTAAYSGQVYIYGEAHGMAKVMDKEFELWFDYYHNKGMRHLFVELPYYTAEFLNLWLRSDDDALVDALYGDMQGTAAHVPATLSFYERIKKSCPETVFHGTDVGHQYGSTGERYLKYLEQNKLESTDQYRLAKEAIAQGINYYKHNSDAYRENKMVENFIRELNMIGTADIMGIYGAAHTGLDSSNYKNTVPCMANQLKAAFGAAIHAEDISSLGKVIEPQRIDTIMVGGTAYKGEYFGRQELRGFKNFAYREFWRLDDAYLAFKSQLKNGDVLPYDNYPMLVGPDEVFMIDLTSNDGTVTRLYYRSDGRIWEGHPVTEQFILGKSDSQH